MNKIILTCGFISGILTSLFVLGFYYIDPSIMLGLKVQYSSMLIVIIMMFFTGYKVRNSLGGWIDFKTVLKTAFGVYSISIILYYIFYYVLFNFVDPSLIEVQRTIQIENFESAVEAGFMDSLMAKEIAAIKEGILNEDLSVTFVVCCYGIAKSLIFGFILSLIVSIILRRH